MATVPAGHSAPMPMPSSARNRKRNQKLGAKPAIKLQIEYHRIVFIVALLLAPETRDKELVSDITLADARIASGD